ncbi:zinc finger protein 665-like [Topomyia yanbarensis]|uniref:zinc finger protein 665-like n=1 Tax=Topomyia yanbarensis TaxID=2498891 RepID=UPI00273B3AB5|nr:zinc finger protein 665-like [Topomyia yanbarensis]XP_058824830.1 zinc finger protein 665-like [Topomyia yanbarensis]XP_058824831.1 zinc finger protein 665-like [Topomyia yanbarensis]
MDPLSTFLVENKNGTGESESTENIFEPTLPPNEYDSFILSETGCDNQFEHHRASVKIETPNCEQGKSTDSHVINNLNDPSQIVNFYNTNFESIGTSSGLATIPEPPSELGARTDMPLKQRKQSINQLFECEMCGKEFFQKQSLQRHIPIHTCERPYACDICGKVFPRRDYLTSHKLVHSSERPHKCEVCGKTFSLKRRLQQHVNIHTGERPYKCEICGKAFIQQGNLILHRVIHSGLRSHKCKMCGKGFLHKHHLQKHVISCHTGEQANKYTSTETIVCEPTIASIGYDSFISDKVCVSKPEYQRASVTEVPKYEQAKSVDDHNINNSTQIGAINNSDLDGIGSDHQTTPESQTKIGNQTDMPLKARKRSYCGNRLFYCDVCGKEFFQKQSLQRHISVHTGERPFACEICGKVFPRRDYLISHKLIHSSERPHKCEVCGKTFTLKRRLQHHATIHTGERPHKCEICGKTFIQQGNLTLHRLIHIGLRSHTCEICGKGFLHKHHLQKHVASCHTEDQSNKCEPTETIVCEPTIPSNGFDSLMLSDKHCASKPEYQPTNVKIESPTYEQGYSANDHDINNSTLPDNIYNANYDSIGTSSDLPTVPETQSTELGDQTDMSVKQPKRPYCGNRRFCCEVCGKEFFQKQSLQRHILNHTGERPFACEICGKIFPRRDYLTTHKLVHSSERPHKCEVCGKTFSLKQRLQKHFAIHTSERPFECEICGKAFIQQGNLTLHLLTHSGLRSHKCEICGKAFLHKHHLQQHVASHIAVQSNECESAETIVCEPTMQPNGFGCDSELEHQRTSVKIVSSKYEQADNHDINNATLIDNSYSTNFESIGSHGDLPPMPESQSKLEDPTNMSMKQPYCKNQLFYCDVCGKEFFQKQSLQRHIPTHTGERPFACEICGKVFLRRDYLTSHKLIHSSERPYKCEVCGKAFSLKQRLQQHATIHSGERPHKCEICGKAFVQQGNLTTHKLIHNLLRPHKCEECGKEFLHKHHLQQHVTIHTGERPYKCSICGKAFTHQGYLNSHKHIHSK